MNFQPAIYSHATREALEEQPPTVYSSSPKEVDLPHGTWTMNSDERALLNTGKTVHGLGSVYTHADVVDLGRRVGYPLKALGGYERYSVIERLDLIATWMIQQDINSRPPTQKESVLTVSRFSGRVSRELPMTNEAMDVLMFHHGPLGTNRLQWYRGGAEFTPSRGEALGVKRQKRRHRVRRVSRASEQDC